MLSNLLNHPENLERISFLRPEHFFARAHQKIFEAALQLVEKGNAIEVTAIASVLRDTNELQAVGGTPYLGQLALAVEATARVEQHAQTIFEKWRLRSAIQAAQSAAAIGLGGGVIDVQGFIEATENELAALANLSRRQGLETAHTILGRQLTTIQEAAERGAQTLGLPTGFKKLDALTGGWMNGELYILAGRPGMGKTTVCGSLILNLTRPPLSGDELPVACAFFSLEMPREQIVVKLACAEASIDVTAVRQNKLRAEEIERLRDVHYAFRRVPLWIDDTPAISIAELRTKVKKLKAEIEQGSSSIPARRLGLVAVDYLQLMTGVRAQNGNREQEVASISQGLKNLAKQEQVAVLALSQLNRGAEKKGADKKPQLSDLRESGAIEQDADTVYFFYRPGYYDKAVAATDAELIIAKQRNGPLASADFYFDGAHAKITTLDSTSDYDDEMDYDNN